MPHPADADFGDRPPVSRTEGSDYRVTFDQLPEPLDILPEQFTIEDFVAPTS